MIKTNLMVIAILTLLYSCSTKDYDSFNPNNIITLTTANDTTPADGATYLKITTKVMGDSLIASANRTIVFTSNQGTFSNTSTAGTPCTTLVAANGTATCFLKSTVAGQVLVTANISNLATATTMATFLTAWPNKLTISLSSASRVDTANRGTTDTNHITVTAILTRAVGTPSSFIPVSFSANSNGYPTGIITNETYSSLNTTTNAVTATATFYPKDSAYTGFIYISGAVEVFKNGLPYTAITGTNELMIKK